VLRGHGREKLGPVGEPRPRRALEHTACHAVCFETWASLLIPPPGTV